MSDWFSNFDVAWMAWTWQTALFFALIALALAVMTLLAILRPEEPRRGMLRIPTTRGDRLFISLLGSAIICVAWIAISAVTGQKDASLWGAVALCLIYGGAVFRYV